MRATCAAAFGPYGRERVLAEDLGPRGRARVASPRGAVDDAVDEHEPDPRMRAQRVQQVRVAHVDRLARHAARHARERDEPEAARRHDADLGPLVAVRVAALERTSPSTSRPPR